LLVEDDELGRRRAEDERKRAALKPPQRGYAKLYHDTVLQADGGCDFDFLRG
jgi:dihydroxy-acid dehydratase